MTFTPENLWYFLIVLPPMLGISLLLRRLTQQDRHVAIVVLLAGALFFVRIMLVAFAGSIGVMPYIQPELVFYGILTVFGVGFSILYVKYVEKRPLAQLGWARENAGKGALWGALAMVPLLAVSPVVLLAAGITITQEFTLEKLFLASTFGLVLGGFYEEVMFRGVMQAHLGKVTTEWRAAVSTALIFVTTHLGYLPFAGYGVYYWYILLMALELSYLRYKCGQVACAVLHGGIVFILVLLV